MAKRTSLSERRNQDVRGTDAFFGPSSAGDPSTGNPGAEVPSPAREAETPAPKPALAKVTLYIRPDQVVVIEKIQLEQRQQTGRKPDKSDLVQEALDLLADKYLLK